MRAPLRVIAIAALAAACADVGAAGDDRRIDFDTEIVPVLTSAGCNSGACHGSAAGRGGLKLSLLGSDAALDHAAIASELEGRRIDLARPERSLVVRKPLGELDHGGDVRLRRGSEGAARLLAWIGQGAERIPSRRLTRFELDPAEPRAAALDEVVRIRALATFDDGRTEDVTRFTTLVADDADALEIGHPSRRPGEIVVRRRGRSIVVARFLDRVVAAPVTLPYAPAAVAPVAEGAPPRTRCHPVDASIDAALASLGLRAAPPVDDAGFLRRARLTLTGRLPGVDELRAFLADPAGDKRERLVDRLLDTEAFVDFQTYRLAALLRVRSLPNDTEVARAYYDWLRRQVAARTPFDELVRALIAARGDSHENGAAAFWRMTAGPREQAELVSEALLASRLRCANCHDHPLDRWTQDDYHGLAAIFARVDPGRVVGLRARGEVTHPRTGEPARTRLPGARFIEPGDRALDELAEWLTDPANPLFARAVVNRLWRDSMGRGLVDPVDDLRATNPATHPALLDLLAEDFARNGHDIRRTLRLIATSAAFARGVGDASLPRDERFGSRAMVRPLEAEVLADAIADVTGVPGRYPGAAAGVRAVHLPDTAAAASELDILGRCDRQSSCDANGAAAGLATRLHLLNGELLNARIAAPEGWLARRAAAADLDDDGAVAAIVDDLVARALGRDPSGAERAAWRRRIEETTGAEARRELLEDIFWSLLTCAEFVTHH